MRNMRILKLSKKHQRGATAIEFGLLVSLISVALITAFSGLGGALSDTFIKVADVADPAAQNTPAGNVGSGVPSGTPTCGGGSSGACT